MGPPSLPIFLSRVTGLIALRQIPNVEFNISADRRYANSESEIYLNLSLRINKDENLKADYIFSLQSCSS